MKTIRFGALSAPEPLLHAGQLVPSDSKEWIMSSRLTSVVVILAMFSLVALSGCSKPEDKLAGHIESMTGIMDDNMDSPKDGVEELHAYMQKNLPGMMEQIGEAMVELDKIEDGAERAERAKEMADALESASKKMMEVGTEFGMKASTDEDAMKYGMEWAASWEKAAGAMEAFSDIGGAFM